MGDNLPASSYGDFQRAVRESFGTKYDGEIARKVRMISLLFAPPEISFVKEEIMPRINYFHYRSGRNIDFYFAGYADSRSTDRAVEVCRVEDKLWYFSDELFNHFREQLEMDSTWRYSGEVDLILSNARYDSRPPHQVVLEYDKAIVVNLTRAKADGAIPSVAALFEKIIRYAEKQNGEDPTWGFSDRMGIELGSSCFVNLLLMLVPPPLRALWKKGRYFAVINAAKA